MLINIDQNLIRRSCSPAPYIGLIESHEIECSFGQAVTSISERFRVEKIAVDAFDPTSLAANVPGCAYMPRPIFQFHRDTVPGFELARLGVHGSPHSFSNSPRRRSISSLVRIFFSIRMVSML